MADAGAREILTGLGRMRPIIDAVLAKYQMSEPALIAPGKLRSGVEARSICMWLAQKLELRLSLAEIGQALGRSRQAALQGFAYVERNRSKDPWLLGTTDALLDQLRGTENAPGAAAP